MNESGFDELVRSVLDEEAAAAPDLGPSFTTALGSRARRRRRQRLLQGAGAALAFCLVAVGAAAALTGRAPGHPTEAVLAGTPLTPRVAMQVLDRARGPVGSLAGSHATTEIEGAGSSSPEEELAGQHLTVRVFVASGASLTALGRIAPGVTPLTFSTGDEYASTRDEISIRGAILRRDGVLIQFVVTRQSAAEVLPDDAAVSLAAQQASANVSVLLGPG